MSRINIKWKREPLSVHEWSHLDLGTMLARRPHFELLTDENIPLDMELPCQMPRLYLADGASLSVQAGRHSYCSPRDNHGPYQTVEVGFPSHVPPETWKEYAEDWDSPTNTVYGYIPLVLVMLFIGAHGGIDREKTFKDFAFQLR